MLKHLSIENFRGIRSFDADLGAVTAFLGPNSSGKTTVLHAIRLACELLRRGIDSDYAARLETYDGRVWIDVTADTLLTDGSKLLSLEDWQALFVDQAVGERVAFTIALSFDDADPIQEVWTQVTCGRNAQLKLSVSVCASGAVERVRELANRSPMVNRQLTDFLREHAPLAVLVPPFYGTVLGEELRSRANIDRLLGSGDQSHVVRNLVTDLATVPYQRLSRFLEDTLGARLTGRTSGDALQTEPTLRVTFADSNGSLEISAAGAGLVNLVALYAALHRWSAETERRIVLFLLDEPEAHLSPKVQASSTVQLARLITQEFHAQLILATHSVDILNRLSEEGARLLRCDRTATPCVTTLDNDASLFDDLAGWVDLTPYTAINFLASRRVLFVEGRDELALLPKLAELRFSNDPGRLRNFRRWSLVELNGAKNEGVAALLGRLLRNDAIRAQARGGSFDILVALDRDYERTPGIGEPTTQDGVTHTRIVWSHHSLESLLVTEPILVRWLRAFLGDRALPDLDVHVRRAITAADHDPELLQDAVGRYTASLLAAGIRAGTSLTAEHGRAVREATERALAEVSAAPASWHHGKSRARFILNHIRQNLPPTIHRVHLPSDIVLLVERTSLAGFGLSIDAIPPEVNTLLERMARP